ncbi:hypothetical protein [Ensifer adhaerens]|uniref:hypothetical protein n=1 Tax=Ensifer adhaerens TaxID=106592 RepID=UPI0011BF4C8D|nr:hypothetical protein [Ensifer adhaerens]
MTKVIPAFYFVQEAISAGSRRFPHMLGAQGCPGARALAKSLGMHYMPGVQNYWRLPMLSQRKLASQFQPRFVLQLWNAMLRVQTRETATFFYRR